MLKNQIYIFFMFILNGIIIGFLFDIFRILRKSFKTSNIITYIEDFIFWILTGIIFIIFIYNFTNGEIRFYMIISLAIGIIIYILTISKIIVNVSVKIIKIFKMILSKIFRMIFTPMRIISRHLCKIILKVKNKFRSIFSTKIKKISNKKKIKKR